MFIDELFIVLKITMVFSVVLDIIYSTLMGLANNLKKFLENNENKIQLIFSFVGIPIDIYIIYWIFTNMDKILC